MNCIRHIVRSCAVVAVLLAGIAVGTTHVGAQQVVNRIAARDRSSVGPVVLRELVSGLRNPWAVVPLADGGALISERPGRLLYLSSREPGAGRLIEVRGVPRVAAIRQGGLLDVIASPRYGEDRTIFFSYAEPHAGGARTAVARAELEIDANAESARLRSVERIFAMNAASSSGQHFGSRLAFDADGLLYITIGDRGTPPRAQDITDHAGSVVRIRVDGSVPPGQSPSAAAAPGLLSWGHRNPQGIAWNARDNRIWLHEHGPRGGDEINIVEAGANYGWPRVTHGVAYSGAEIAESTTLPGMADPLLHWTPSIAPSGMAFLSGRQFSEWDGDLLVGALAGQHLRRVALEGRTVTAQEVLFSGFGRFRDVRVADQGDVYILTDAAQGGLFRLERTR